MKKIFFALVCVVSLAMVVACGGDGKKGGENTPKTGNEEIDQKLEQAEKKLSEMTGPEKCEATWKKRYEGKLTLADVQPDFEFTEKLEGYDAFMGNGVNLAKAVYQKKDGSKITPEEFKAFAEKIYAVTQKLAQDGKVVKGFGSHLDVKTREQALEEISLEKLLADGGSNLEWAFLKDDRFEACYVTMQNTSKSSYVTVSFGEGTQKNLDEALKDAEKYLN